MLVIKRRIGEKIRLSNGIVITFVAIEGRAGVIGIDAPKQIGVNRSDPCAICGRAAFDYYLGYKDIPLCGDVTCEARIKADNEGMECHSHQN